MVVYSKWIGKIAQATVVCALISCFFHEGLQSACGFPVHTALLWLGVALTLCALVFYARRGIRLYKAGPEAEKAE